MEQGLISVMVGNGILIEVGIGMDWSMIGVAAVVVGVGVEPIFVGFGVIVGLFVIAVVVNYIVIQNYCFGIEGCKLYWYLDWRDSS